MMPLPSRYLRPVPLPTPFRPGDPRHLDPLGLHVRDTTDPHKVRDRLVDIGVLRRNEDGTYSPYLPTKADLVNGKVPASQLPEDQQGVTDVLVDGASVVSGGTASVDLSGKVDKEQGKGLSSNDYTAEEKTKLANAIQAVKVNGTALTPDAQRAVNIPAASTSAQGVVKLNNATNSTSQTEAATANAARLAYNRGTEGLNKANQVAATAAKLSGDNYFSGVNYFYGHSIFSAGTTFEMRPSVSSPGMCRLVATDLPFSAGVNYTNISGSFYWEDDSGGHSINDVFSGGAIRTILDANQIDFDEYDSVNFYSSGAPAVPSIDLSNSWNSPIVLLTSNDSGGHDFWGYANISGFFYLSSLYRNSYGPDGGYDWYRYSGEVELIDENWSSYYGRVPVEITWKVMDRYIEVHVEYLWMSFMPYEGYESLSIDTDGSYGQTPPPLLQASTNPADPYYSTSYAEMPAEYGWAPCIDSVVATLNDVPDVGGAVSNHDANPSAHSNISLNADRITSGKLSVNVLPVATSSASGITRPVKSSNYGNGGAIGDVEDVLRIVTNTKSAKYGCFYLDHVRSVGSSDANTTIPVENRAHYDFSPSLVASSTSMTPRLRFGDIHKAYCFFFTVTVIQDFVDKRSGMNALTLLGFGPNATAGGGGRLANSTILSNIDLTVAPMQPGLYIVSGYRHNTTTSCSVFVLHIPITTSVVVATPAG